MAWGMAWGMACGMLSSMADSEKVRENRLRRMAQRQGLILQKSRRRDPRAPDFGTYWLVDRNYNTIVAGESFGMDLDAVEAALNE